MQGIDGWELAGVIIRRLLGGVWPIVFVAVMVIVTIDWFIARHQMPPGTAVRWGPLQFGVVLKPVDVAGWCLVRHAASGVEFAVHFSQLEPVNTQ